MLRMQQGILEKRNRYKHIKKFHGADVLAEEKQQDNERRMANAPPPQHQCNICTKQFVQRKTLYRHLPNEHGSDAEVKTEHREQKKAKMDAQKAATKKIATEKKRREVPTSKRTDNRDRSISRKI